MWMWETSTQITFEAELIEEEETSEKTTRRMEPSEADTHTPTQGDVLGTSGESVVEPPAAKKARKIELVHVPKRTFGLPAQEQARGYGPPTPPDENPEAQRGLK
eukprot:5971015-Amphidinium_carterae.1